MNKENYYNKIKKYIYRKFEELEVAERNDGNDLYLHYKNKQYCEIRLKKKLGELNYYYAFREKVIKLIPMEKRDFEIILSGWVEDTFKIKLKLIQKCNVLLSSTLHIPLK